MSYSEARNHFEKARLNAADSVTIEMLEGLKHLSHALEEDIRTLEKNIRNLQNQRAGTRSPINLPSLLPSYIVTRCGCVLGVQSIRISHGCRLD
jgi:hypothetical protein